MFKSMSIPRKLGVSFAAINASAAIVMLVFFANIMMIRGTTDSNNLSQSIHAKALALETAILRQNSQFRGFLVTADKTYLKSYEEGREDYDKISAELETQLTDPENRERLENSRRETLAWRKKWGDRLIAMAQAGQLDEAVKETRAAGKAVLVSDAVLPLRDIRDEQTKLIDVNSERQEKAIKTALVALVIGGVLLIGVAFLLARALSRSIARPISSLTDTMGALAAGDNSVAVPEADRADELGAMARAVLIFRDAARAKAQSEADQAHVVEAIGQGLEALSSGDMTYVITEPFAGNYDRLRQAFNHSVEGLEASLSQVAATAQSVYSGSSEIREASEDLSRRTELQAASIEETAAATQEVTEMVAGTARGAGELRQAINAVAGDATEGSHVVRSAVTAMNEIEKSSHQIGEIINVIDAIAFQTNLLALNAGVEAARAGESGKGFAVVADEVRGLAQRSAGAAKDIKSLITNSTERVAQGVSLVAETGAMLDRILSKISDVTALIGKIAVATDAQSDQLREVNASVVQMDDMTQQNAAMVEQTTACTRNLAAEADELAELVRRFKLKAGEIIIARRSPTARRVEASPRAAASAPRMPVAGNLAVKPDEDDWSAF